MKQSAMIGAWLVATALAVGIGIGAVQLAGAQVTDDPIQPISADEVPTRSAAPDETAAGSASAAASTTVPLETTTTVPQSTTVAVAPPTTTGGGAATAPPTTSQNTAPPTTIGAPPQVTVYQLIGGSVSIEVSPGVVNLVWATPQGGFVTEVESAGPNQVEVDFESGSHKSKFRAEWSGGVLDIERREEAED